MWSAFSFRGGASTAGPRSIAPAVEAKNSPPDCFLNAPTVLKEIIIFCLFSTLAQSRGVFLRGGRLYKTKKTAADTCTAAERRNVRSDY